ncbi:hypothetical protein TRVL_08618 [Trypanosoma vivax]|nr:hypothetical protein TRVL_08618 [Trypanosoma vivax]
MFFLLFLFLGTLGAQAGTNVATCTSLEGKLTCNIENCSNKVDRETIANVTCTCAKGAKEDRDCALELAEDDEGNTCILISKGGSGNPIPCKRETERQCTFAKHQETETEKITLQLECICYGAEGTQNQGKKAEGAQNQGKKAEGAENQGKKAEGAQNQGKKGEGAQEQGKKAEGAQNQGKKGEDAQTQGKKPEDAQSQGKSENEKPVQHENAGIQNSERPGEVPSSESSTGAPSASEGNAEQSAEHEKKEEGVSAAARNSQEVAFLYPLFSFIAVMPRIN